MDGWTLGCDVSSVLLVRLVFEGSFNIAFLRVRVDGISLMVRIAINDLLICNRIRDIPELFLVHMGAVSTTYVFDGEF